MRAAATNRTHTSKTSLSASLSPVPPPPANCAHTPQKHQFPSAAALGCGKYSLISEKKKNRALFDFFSVDILKDQRNSGFIQ
jgi:hypothetical protein